MLVNTIASLFRYILHALWLVLQFLTVVVLGLIAGILLILPWLMRSLALIGWLAGTFLVWMSVNNLYEDFTPALPLLALSAIPAILSSALVVWLFYRGQQGKLWGAMTLWGVLGWLIWKGSSLLADWQYGSLVIQVLPATLSAVLLLYINIRWGVVIRARRFAKITVEGGDAG